MGQETGGAVPARQTGIDEKWWRDHVPLCYLGEHNGLTPFGRSGGCVSRPVARGSGQ